MKVSVDKLGLLHHHH